jgi:DNA-binding GntR family transcriptional regulator
MRAAAVAGDVPGVIEHSVGFHSAIMAASGNRLLYNIWRSLRIETRTTITMLAEGLDHVEIAESHQPIVDAIAGGDPERAARVAREHQDYFEALPTPDRPGA